MNSRDPALDAALTDLCTRLGLSPWEVLHRPRLHARADAVLAMSADIRAGAQAAMGIRPRDARGRFVKGGGR